MQNITPNDVTGIAALDPQYMMKAQQVAGLPLDKQIQSLLGDGNLDPRTVALVLKARKLKELSSAGLKQVNPATVSQEVDQAINNYTATHAHAQNGLAGIPLSANMFGHELDQDPVQGKANGGLIAFAAGDVVPPANGVSSFNPMFSDNAGYGMPILSQDEFRQLAQTNPQPQQPQQQQIAGIDPKLVSQYLTGALGAKDPTLTALSGIDTRLIKPNYADLDRHIADAERISKLTAPKGDEQSYIDEAMKFAQDHGMNQGEAEAMVTMARYRDQVTEYNSDKNASKRGLTKASGDIADTAMNLYEKHLPINNVQGALLSLAIAGKDVANSKTESQKALMEAQRDTDLKTAELKSAMYKNEVSAQGEGRKEFHEALVGYNDAKRREDELIRYKTSEDTAALRGQQSLKATVGVNTALVRNPAFAYQAGLNQLAEQEAAAQAEGPAGAAKVTAIQEARNRLTALQGNAVATTPTGYAANTKAQTQSQIAQWMMASHERIAAMKDTEIIKLESELASLPDISDNPMLQGMRTQLQNTINSRKSQLGLTGAASASTVNPRRITIAGTW